jgi:hypothetical protein
MRPTSMCTLRSVRLVIVFRLKNSLTDFSVVGGLIMFRIDPIEHVLGMKLTSNLLKHSGNKFYSNA